MAFNDQQNYGLQGPNKPVLRAGTPQAGNTKQNQIGPAANPQGGGGQGPYGSFYNFKAGQQSGLGSPFTQDTANPPEGGGGNTNTQPAVQRPQPASFMPNGAPPANPAPPVLPPAPAAPQGAAPPQYGYGMDQSYQDLEGAGIKAARAGVDTPLYSEDYIQNAMGQNKDTLAAANRSQQQALKQGSARRGINTNSNWQANKSLQLSNSMATGLIGQNNQIRNQATVGNWQARQQGLGSLQSMLGMGYNNRNTDYNQALQAALMNNNFMNQLGG